MARVAVERGRGEGGDLLELVLQPEGELWGEHRVATIVERHNIRLRLGARCAVGLSRNGLGLLGCLGACSFRSGGGCRLRKGLGGPLNARREKTSDAKYTLFTKRDSDCADHGEAELGHELARALNLLDARAEGADPGERLKRFERMWDGEPGAGQIEEHGVGFAVELVTKPILAYVAVVGRHDGRHPCALEVLDGGGMTRLVELKGVDLAVWGDSAGQEHGK
mmetsp:Transcript_3910/g.12339  ORF Transcript_3910/g.12339 Transcript_3910/m.12339 type:complete len:223 (-) Transcript_3910:472-1140(-)